MAKLVKLALGWFGLSFLSASVFSISSAQHLEFFSERVWISLCLSCMAYCIWSESLRGLFASSFLVLITVSQGPHIILGPCSLMRTLTDQKPSQPAGSLVKKPCMWYICLWGKGARGNLDSTGHLPPAWFLLGPALMSTTYTSLCCDKWALNNNSGYLVSCAFWTSLPGRRVWSSQDRCRDGWPTGWFLPRNSLFFRHWPITTPDILKTTKHCRKKLQDTEINENTSHVHGLKDLIDLR